MINRLTRTLLSGAAFVLTVAGFAPAPALAEDFSVISVQTGHSVIVDAPALSRVAVGDGRIAGVVPIGTSQIVINGKTAGHTTIFIWCGARRQSYEVTVTEQGFDDIAKLLRSAINEPNVQVVAFGSNMVVRGNVSDAAAFARLDDIIGRFKGAKFSTNGKGDGIILNTVKVMHPLGTLQDQLAAIPGASGIRVDPDPKGNVVVSGSVHDRTTAQQVLDRVKGLAGPYLPSDGKIVDRLSVETVSQVDTKVYVLEVDKTAQSQIGLRLQGAIPGGNVGGFTLTTPSFVGVENPARGSQYGNALNVGNIARAVFLAPTLDLMLQEGHAKLLSSFNLVTVPGMEANFLVGGKLPIPVSSGLGAVSIQFTEFGVRLKVTPTLLGNGDVESKINPEVSDLDFADGVVLNGFTVPAIKTSMLSTDVITRSGESIVMGGLMRRIEQRNVTKIPLLADIPFLGQLFRSTNYQKQESDVIFVMTPTIITR